MLRFEGLRKGTFQTSPLSRQRKEVRTWTSLFVPNGKSVVLLTAFANWRWSEKLWTLTGTQSSDNYARLLFPTCRHWKKISFTSATNILQMMKRNSLSLSAAKKLLRSCLPKPCTVCRKKSGKPYCCIISLIWANARLQSFVICQGQRYSPAGQAQWSC